MVSFRFMKSSDAQMVYDWRTAEHVAKFMFTRGPANYTEHVNWMQKVLVDRTKAYYIIICDNVDVGVLNFANLNFEEKSGEFGTYIGHQSMQDRRAGVEVEAFAIKTFFHLMHFENLYAEVLNFNKGVIELHKAFGFQIINSNNPDVTKLLLKKENIKFLK